jgi:geranylgeranyl diphosphate synthase, type I
MTDAEMAVEQKLMMKAGMILQEKGRIAVDLARRRVLYEQLEHASLRDALRYFSEGWNDFLHPALVSLACEAVGGKPEMTDKVGAALVLLAGGADIHDDIIDESVIKGSEQTVFGKFEKDVAILVGDTLLLEGVYLLHEACDKLDVTKKKAILDTVRRAFVEISNAEATEARMRGRSDIPKQQYLDIITHKVAAGEAAMRIGALIGDGTPEEVELLAEYGRCYGILMTIRDEFIDVFEKEELLNRMEKEVLPLPVVLTLADESKKRVLLQLLRGKITEEKIEEIVDVATSSPESSLLISEMKQMVQQIILRIRPLRYCRENLELAVTATLEDL